MHDNSEAIKEMQKLVDAILETDQFSHYVRQAKLELLDSKFGPIDEALKAGLLKGYKPSLMDQVFGG